MKIKKTLTDFVNDEILLVNESAEISEAMQYHIDNKHSVINCQFRYASESFFEFINEARNLASSGDIKLDRLDQSIVATDLGEFAYFNETKIPLDCPMLIDDAWLNEEVLTDDEAKKVDKLNEPERGGGKTFQVWTKRKDGKVIRIEFSTSKPSELSEYINDKKRRNAFAERHNCDAANDKTTASYWACRVPYYAKQLGLSGGGKYWW